MLQIFSTAEDLVLESHSFLQARQILEKLDLPGAEGSEASEHLARSLLTVIESTFSRGRSGDHPDLPSVLVERLSTLLQKLSDLQLATSDTSWETPGVSGELRSW